MLFYFIKLKTMVKDNIQYVKLEEVLSRLLRHPLLQELSMEAAILVKEDV